MKAMQLMHQAAIETSPLRRVNVPAPEPGAGQIRLRVHCCAICRTDLHVIEGDLPAARLPVIPGHQIVGTVDDLGAGVTTPGWGQRVGVAWLRMTCGDCEFCRSGRENLCAAARFTGYHADGGFAEFALVPAEFAYPLPAGFSDAEAAPLLCAGIVGYRALIRAALPPEGRLALYGFGSSAHVIIQVAVHRGHQVFVVSRSSEHRALARQLGATWTGASADELPAPVDSAILLAPAGELVPPALRQLKRGGTLSIAGIHLSDVPPLDYQQHLFYERDLRSVTCNTRDDGRQLLAEAAAIPIRPQVTTYGLEDANRALQDLKAGRINGTGVLVIA